MYGNNLDKLNLVTYSNNIMCSGDGGSALFVKAADGKFKLIGILNTLKAAVYGPDKTVNEMSCYNYAIYENITHLTSWLKTAIK